MNTRERERTLRKLSPERRAAADDCFVSWRDRPKRKMWEAWRIAEWYVEHQPQRLRDGLWPACFACGMGDDEWRNFERAHLITRCFSGLDGPQNLVLLCKWCHKQQPDFLPGDEERAWAWVEARPGYWDTLLQAFQDVMERGAANWRGHFVTREVAVAAAYEAAGNPTETS